MSERRTLYLITAYRTLSNATFTNAHSKKAKAALKAAAPASQDGNTSVGGSSGVDMQEGEEAQTDVLDEKIFEIQYVRLRCVDSAWILEPRCG